MLSIPRTEQGTIDLAEALLALIEQYGSDKPTNKRKANEQEEEEDDAGDEEEGGKKKSTKKKKKETVAVEENRGLAEAIAEISSIYYKNGERMKGGVFSKAGESHFIYTSVICSFVGNLLSFVSIAKAIREAETELSTGKEAMKLKGIGKGIGAAIDEFRTSGMIKKVCCFILLLLVAFFSNP